MHSRKRKIRHPFHRFTSRKRLGIKIIAIVNGPNLKHDESMERQADQKVKSSLKYCSEQLLSFWPTRHCDSKD